MKHLIEEAVFGKRKDVVELRIKVTMNSGREFEITLKESIDPILDDKMWLSTNGPMIVLPHCQNGASIGIDHIYPPQP